MTVADLQQLKRAYDELIVHGDAQGAEFILRRIRDDFAWEIILLIRAGHRGEAANRMQRYLNPKFPSESDCATHVGESKHFGEIHPILAGKSQ